MRSLKILVIQFKFIGDAAVLIPSLREIRKKFPKAQIHVVMSPAAAHVIELIPWIDRVWSLPRGGGVHSFFRVLSIIRSLRNEHFDVSFDFVGNDRGALIGLCAGAVDRFGFLEKGGFLGRSFTYTRTIRARGIEVSEAQRLKHLLTLCEIEPTQDVRSELYSDSKLFEWAKQNLPENAILCHLTTTAPKREWQGWADLYNLAQPLRDRMVFMSGPSPRERAVLEAFKQKVPQARVMDCVPSVAHLMALIDQASAQISGDSAPGHLAAGLKTPYVVLFGPACLSQWDPGGLGEVLVTPNCECTGATKVCLRARPCFADISAQQVYEALLRQLESCTESLRV
jgi:heptosyltransferase III